MLSRSIIGAIAAALAATFSPPVVAQGKGETARIQDYPGIGNMLYRIAATKGYCEKHGITCQLQTIPSGPLGAQALLAKSIDVGFFPPEVQINAMIKGAALKAIVSGATLNVFLIVIRNELSAPNAGSGYPAIMADLKGKKIGVPVRGAGAEFEFVLLAQKAGLKAEDFNFVAVGSPNTAYGALTSKQVDAEMSFEPSGALCDVLKTCRTIWRGSESRAPAETFATNGASSNMVVTQETIDKSPHVVDALIAAGEDADAFIQNPGNYAEALTIAQSYFKFDMPRGDEVMDAALKRAIPAYKAPISRPALKAIADNMLATKQIEVAFDPATLVYAKAP
jgi:NitT/TauT family transport system substrate-binding protein